MGNLYVYCSGFYFYWRGRSRPLVVRDRPRVLVAAPALSDSPNGA